MSAKDPDSKSTNGSATSASSSVDEMLLAALERGSDSLGTGRYLITFKDARLWKVRNPACASPTLSFFPRLAWRSWMRWAVDQVLTEMGLITGEAEDDVVDKVRQVAGVADVSPELLVHLPPPDFPVIG